MPPYTGTTLSRGNWRQAFQGQSGTDRQGPSELRQTSGEEILRPALF